METSDVFVVATSHQCLHCSDVYEKLPEYEKMAEERGLRMVHFEMSLSDCKESYVAQCKGIRCGVPDRLLSFIHYVPSYHFVTAKQWNNWSHLGRVNSYLGSVPLEVWLTNVVEESKTVFSSEKLMSAISAVKSETSEALISRLSAHIRYMKEQARSLDDKIAEMEGYKTTLSNLHFGSLASLSTLLKGLEEADGQPK
jgi:hypothetical protein